jgi:hypothetical protein
MREQRGGILLRVANEAIVESREVSLQPDFRAARSAIISDRERGCANDPSS